MIDRSDGLLKNRNMIFFYLFFSGFVLWKITFAPFFGFKYEAYDFIESHDEEKTVWVSHHSGYNHRTLHGDFTKHGQFLVKSTAYFVVLFEGAYSFKLKATDQAILAIDGTTIIKTFLENIDEEKRETIYLKRGIHQLECEYKDSGGPYSWHLQWSKKKGTYSDIPPFLLFPPRTTGQWFFSLLGIVLLFGWIGLSSILFRKIWADSPGYNRSCLLLFGVLFMVLLCFSLTDLFEHRQRSVHGCDTFGYLQAASSIKTWGIDQTSLFDETIPLVYQRYQNKPDVRYITFFQGPHAYYITDFGTGKLVNQYPPGFPLILSAFLKLGSETATYFVTILSFLVLVLLFVVFWFRKGKILCAFVGATMMLYQPLLFEHAVLLMSDIPSTLILCASVLLGTLKVKNYKIIDTIIGFLLALGILIRYSNVFFCVPLFILLVFRRHRLRRVVWIAVIVFVCGVLPLALYQYHLFGNPFHTTYPFTNVGKMSLSNIPSGIGFYVRALSDEFSLPFFITFMGGVIVGFKRRDSRILTLSLLTFIVLHLLFICTNGVLLARYLVPILPLAIFFVTLALSELEYYSRNKKWSRIAVVVLFLLLVLYPLKNRSLLPWPADRLPEEKSYRVSLLTEPECRILCDDLTGSVRLYGNRTGYRALFIDENLFLESVRILKDYQIPLYLLIDNPKLWERKRLLEKEFQLLSVDDELLLFQIL